TEELRICLSHHCEDFTRSLRVHLELDAPRRVRMLRQPADARAQRLAAIESPGERGVLAPRHVAELAAAPRQAHRIGVVRVVGLARERERITDAELAPDF